MNPYCHCTAIVNKLKAQPTYFVPKAVLPVDLPKDRWPKDLVFVLGTERSLSLPDLGEREGW